MRKSLDGLHWEHAWLSQMGCLKACLHYLGRETTWPRLYGLSAQAFIINMHETACPSGPTAWRSSEMLGALLPNLGGSLPNDVFSETLGLPTLWVPHSYPACSQHAPN